MRDRDPDHLHPYALAKMNQLFALAGPDPAFAGLSLVLQETYRDEDTQAEDWAKGRDGHGNVVNAALVVTQARPGQSWHGLRRWIRACADCGHHPEFHGPRGESQPGFQSCLTCLRRCLSVSVSAWARVPASLAWHFYIRDPDGSLEGLGANDLSTEDRVRYERLGALARSIGVRWGGDFDGDGIPFEKGEWDLGHFEARPEGFATLSQVHAALDIQGSDLTLGHLTA